MELVTLILIAIGLSVDSFAVSLSCGLIMCEITFRKAARIAFSMAFFQALLPLIGWFIGSKIASYVVVYDHWIAFGLLTIIGGKMIAESLGTEEENKKKANPLDFKYLIGISLATSIDAFIIGISFAFIKVNLFFSTFIIGFTTFFFSMLGILFGKKTGVKFGKKMETAGGIILFLIGLKILIEHLCGN
jgi:manganese efflux pump family protein